MNWYKKAQENQENKLYTDIGHAPAYEHSFLWISDLSGNNFNKARTDAKTDEGYSDSDYSYDHDGLAYDVGIDMQAGAIQRRYDGDKNIVSIMTNPNIVTMREFPNRLINRLYQEFGNDITILDYSQGSPKRVI